MHRSTHHLPPLRHLLLGSMLASTSTRLCLRHHRKVPVGLYHRFTRKACRLADAYAHGRVVSVLEGGYSDRALTSGAMAHLCGLVDLPGQAATSDSDGWVDHAWWGEGNLVKVRYLVHILLQRIISSHVFIAARKGCQANLRPRARAWRNGLPALSVSSLYSTAVWQTPA